MGGTGTFDIDCDLEGVTDLQVGSYCFMDVQYRAIGDADSDVFDYFEPSLFVLTTAISQPVPDLITSPQRPGGTFTLLVDRLSTA